MGKKEGTIMSKPRFTKEIKKEIARFKAASEKEKTYEWCLKMVEIQPNLLAKVPKTLRTEELCNLALDVSMSFTTPHQRRKACRINSIPKALRTDSVYLKAVHGIGENIKHIPHPTDEMIRIALEISPEAVEFVAPERVQFEEWERAILNEGALIRFVPKELQTKELMSLALERDDQAYSYLAHPEWFTEEELVDLNPRCIRFIENPSWLLIKRTIKNRGYFMYYDLEKYNQPLGRAMCEFLHRFDQRINDLPHVLPEMLIQEAFNGAIATTETKECLWLALKNRTMPLGQTELDTLLKGIYQRFTLTPNELKLIDHLIRTIPSNDEVYFPTKSEALDEKIKKNPNLFKTLYHKEQTPDLVQLALTQDARLIRYVRSDLKSYRLCRWTIQQHPELIDFSPYHEHFYESSVLAL